MRGSWGGRTALWTLSWSCLRLCPGYFKCVVVYARHRFHCLTQTRAEVGLLVELWTCRVILLWSTLDSFDGIRVLDRRIGCLPKKDVLYFRCEGRSVLLCAERALCVSINYYNPARSWHFELEVCIMRYCIESSKCGSSEQCVIATTEGDVIED